MGFVGNLRRVLLIGNPMSGGGRAGRHLNEVADALGRFVPQREVVRTARAGDAQEAAREFTGDAILSFGGDGTFNEVLNGADLTRCALGVLAAGAGNVLAKEIGLPRDPQVAVRALAEGKIVPFDLGVCNGRRFCSMVGVGVDAHVVNIVHERRRGGLTQLHYVPVLLRETFRFEHWEISATVDGAPFASGVEQVCVGNTHSYGGPIEMTSGACPTDGLLDVMASRAAGPLEMATTGLAALLRSTHICAGMRYGRGRRFRVTSPRKDVPWQVDGDPGGFLPAEVHCEPGRLRMIVPRAYRCGARA